MYVRMYVCVYVWRAHAVATLERLFVAMAVCLFVAVAVCLFVAMLCMCLVTCEGPGLNTEKGSNEHKTSQACVTMLFMAVLLMSMLFVAVFVVTILMMMLANFLMTLRPAVLAVRNMKTTTVPTKNVMRVSECAAASTSCSVTLPNVVSMMVASKTPAICYNLSS